MKNIKISREMYLSIWVGVLIIGGIFIYKSFANVSGEFSATVTTPNVVGSTIPATIDFTGGAAESKAIESIIVEALPENGVVLTIGSCAITFLNAGDDVDELDCSDNFATISRTTSSVAMGPGTPRNANEIGAKIQAIVGRTLTDPVHGLLEIGGDGGTYAYFKTAGPEISATNINVFLSLGSSITIDFPLYLGTYSGVLATAATATLTFVDGLAPNADDNSITVDDIVFGLGNTAKTAAEIAAQFNGADFTNGTSEIADGHYTALTSDAIVTFSRVTPGPDGNADLTVADREYGAKAQVTRFTPLAPTVGETYKATINGIDYFHTVVDGDTVKILAEALQLQMDANADVSCTEDDVTITCTADVAGTPFTYDATVLADYTPPDLTLPQVLSAGFTATHTLVIQYSEPVTSIIGDYSSLVSGVNSKTVSGIVGSGTSTITLTFIDNAPPIQIFSNSTGSINIGTGVMDLAGNHLLALVGYDVADKQAPTIQSAKTGNLLGVGLDNVTLTFSENVDATGILGAGWALTGSDSVGRTITANDDPADILNKIVLTITPAFPSDDPDATVTYGGAGNLFDATTNELLIGSSALVDDGVRPTLISAKITGPNTITADYSEAVTGTAGNYTSLAAGLLGRTITAVTGSGSAIHTLTVSGGALSINANGTMTIFSSAMPPLPFADLSSNIITTLTNQPVTDGQASSAPATPTAVAGPDINAVEENDGFNVVVGGLLTKGAVAGDTLELLLDGSSFVPPLVHPISPVDIVNEDYTFNIVTGKLGSDGTKNLTARFTDLADNMSPESLALVLNLDTTAPSAPTASPVAGTYSASQNVTLIGSAIIRYTTDGTTPGTCASGSLYSSTISVSSTTTIMAIDCDAAGNISDLGTFAYTINTSRSRGSGGSSARVAIVSPPGSRVVTPLTTVTTSVVTTPSAGAQLVRGGYSLTASSAVQSAASSVTQAASQGAAQSVAQISTEIPFTRIMSRGTTGGEVARLQQFLVTHSLMTQREVDTGPGIDGPQTTRAVRDFQKEKGISQTGIVGLLTLEALNKVLAEQVAKDKAVAEAALNETPLTPPEPPTPAGITPRVNSPSLVSKIWSLVLNIFGIEN